MQGLVIQPVRLALGGPRPAGWRPALGQNVTTTPVSPPGMMVAPPPAPPVPFVDSALVAFLFDALGAASSGILAYAAASRKNKLAYVFGAMTAVFAFKGVGDLMDIRER